LLFELRYGAFLSYNPPRSIASQEGRHVRYRDLVKKGGQLPARGGTYGIYDLAALRISEDLESDGVSGMLREFLGADVVVVPAPRSAPLPGPEAFWPAKEICDALVKRQVARETAAVLERTRAIPKSSFSAPGERPRPSVHFDSIRALPRMMGATRITIVDDVVTRGATLIASASRVKEVFPEAEVLGFALLRTKGIYACGDEPLDPISSMITYDPRTDSSTRLDY
jgi:hypothetical protein